MAIKLLSLLGQRYTLAAGNMAVVLFDTDVDVGIAFDHRLATMQELKRCIRLRSFPCISGHRSPLLQDQRN